MSFIEIIFARAMSEPDFAKQLFANADHTVIHYELTTEERSEIKSVSES